MTLWNDQLTSALAKQTSDDEKVNVSDLKKDDRIVTAGGQVAVLTGHKTKDNVGLKLSNGDLTWISIFARVHLAK